MVRYGIVDTLKGTELGISICNQVQCEKGHTNQVSNPALQFPFL